MHRAPLATRAATITINDGKGLRAAVVSVRGFLSFQMELVHMAAVTCQCFVAGPSPKRARASSQGQAISSPAEADLRYMRERTPMAAVTRPCLVAEPSPKCARASSQGQAMLSPVDLNIQAVVKILRWRLQQGGTPSSLEQLESDFFDWWGVRFNPVIVKEPDFATFLRNRPDKFEVYSLEGVTKVRLSAQVVEKIREKIREGLCGGTARAAPSPRRRASEDASLLPFVASSSRPEGRSAPSCARTSTAAGSVQSKPTAPAAELVPCPRWVAASARPKPPVASSSTPDGRVAKLQSSAPGEAARQRRRSTSARNPSADDLRPGRSTSADYSQQVDRAEFVSQGGGSEWVLSSCLHQVWCESGQICCLRQRGPPQEQEQAGTISSPRMGQGPRRPRRRGELESARTRRSARVDRVDEK